MQPPEGRKYTESVEQQSAGPIQKCVQAAGVDLGKFEVLVGISQGGVIDQLVAPGPIFECLRPLQGKAMAPPPSFPYWIKLDVDPATFTSAATN
jgi:hypothetical protein